MEYDAVIVGSGAGGLTAAVVAAQQGLRTLLLESTPYFGGTTAWSGGAAWIPCNNLMQAIGRDDDREQAKLYLRGIIGNLYDDEKIDAFLDHGPRMVDYLLANSDVRMWASDFPDYEMEMPGASVGRTIFAEEDDARRLGPLRAALRPPRRDTLLFGSMQLAPADPYILKRAHKSVPAMLHAARLFAQFAFHRLIYGRGMRVTNGNALAARLLLSARDAGVTLWNEARATRIVLEDGAVRGIDVLKDGETQRIAVRKGVVLASGGFGHDQALREKYVPHARHGYSLQPEGSRGDGIRMGVAAGGRIVEDNVANGIWQPISVWHDPAGAMQAEIYWFSRLSPGSLIVDAASGKRFVNEASNYHSFVREMNARGIERGWQISDSRAVSKYGIGLVKPWPFRPSPWIRRGYLKRAGTIRDLARQIGLDPATLENSVGRFNDHAIHGRDPDFHKGESGYSRYLGDPEHQPNPCVGPIVAAPFYAVPLHPGETSAAAGLETNAQAQVLGSDNRPIPGLYAAGLDNNSIMRGTYPGAGASIGPAMTFGYIAARHLAHP